MFENLIDLVLDCEVVEEENGGGILYFSQELNDYVDIINSKINENSKKIKVLKKELFIQYVEKELLENNISQEFDVIKCKDAISDIEVLVKSNELLRKIKSNMFGKLGFKESDLTPF